MITYLEGDATDPQPAGDDAEGMPPQASQPRIIVHICNSVGGWGRGFVVALSKRWPEPEREYRQWFERSKIPAFPESAMLGIGPFRLGAIQPVRVEPDPLVRRKEWNPSIVVINMIAQEGYGPKNQAQHRDGLTDSKPPIRYDALDECLGHVAELRDLWGLGTMHMPRIGCGLAGGKWSEVEPLIQKHLSAVPVYVYDLPGQPYVDGV